MSEPKKYYDQLIREYFQKVEYPTITDIKPVLLHDKGCTYVVSFDGAEQCYAVVDDQNVAGFELKYFERSDAYRMVLAQWLGERYLIGEMSMIGSTEREAIRAEGGQAMREWMEGEKDQPKNHGQVGTGFPRPFPFAIHTPPEPRGERYVSEAGASEGIHIAAPRPGCTPYPFSVNVPIGACFGPDGPVNPLPISSANTDVETINTIVFRYEQNIAELEQRIYAAEMAAASQAAENEKLKSTLAAIKAVSAGEPFELTPVVERSAEEEVIIEHATDHLGADTTVEAAGDLEIVGYEGSFDGQKSVALKTPFDFPRRIKPRFNSNGHQPSNPPAGYNPTPQQIVDGVFAVGEGQIGVD